MRGAEAGVGGGRREPKHCTSHKALWQEAIQHEYVLAQETSCGKGQSNTEAAQKCTNKKRKNGNGKNSNSDDRHRRPGSGVRWR